MPTFRFYGPTEPLNRKTFKMPDPMQAAVRRRAVAEGQRVLVAHDVWVDANPLDQSLSGTVEIQPSGEINGIGVCGEPKRLRVHQLFEDSDGTVVGADLVLRREKF